MKRLLMTIAMTTGLATAAQGAEEAGREELRALMADHRPVYEACYSLASAGVLRGEMRETIVAGAADRRKGLACALGIASHLAGIHVTDEASLERLRAHYERQKWCVIAEVDLKNARTALELFYLENNRYPDTLAETTGFSPATPSSAVTIAFDAQRVGYRLTATNDGCDQAVTLASDGSITKVPKKQP
jgi:hypothetical protein